MSLETKPFVVAEHLQNEQDVAGYLTLILIETAYPALYSDAIDDTAKARGGVAALASETGNAEAEIRHAIAARNETAGVVLGRIHGAYQHLATSRKVA